MDEQPSSNSAWPYYLLLASVPILCAWSWIEDWDDDYKGPLTIITIVLGIAFGMLWLSIHKPKVAERIGDGWEMVKFLFTAGVVIVFAIVFVLGGLGAIARFVD